MSGRVLKILGRLPAHMEATRPDKQLYVVSEALALDLDVLSADMAAVRRAHRLGHADHQRDVLLLGGLHGISQAELAVLFMRLEPAGALMSALAAAATDEERDAAAEALCALWGIDAPSPRLPLYAPPVEGGDPPDLDAAAQRLIQHASSSLRYQVITDALRARVKNICDIHAGGNGTVRAMLLGAANALDLDLGPVYHSDDRFWHAAEAFDRLELTRPVQSTDDQGKPVETAEPFPAASEVLGLEENPLRRERTDQVGRYHAELFSVLRRGFDTSLVRAHIYGRDNRTVGPMVVNRDEGHGVGYVRDVPPGQLLEFTEQGRVTLEGVDVTSYAYAWEGACFADADALDERDFVFADEGADPFRTAVFAVAIPDGALDRDFVFPHSGVDVPVPGIAVGETRMAFFVQQAHLNAGGTVDHPAVFAVTPRPFRAVANESVFAAGPADAAQVAADVALSWLEHEAYAVRIWIPARFNALVAAEELGRVPDVPSRVLTAVERFRPVGVRVEVKYIDEHWVLGEGYLHSEESENPIDRIRSGTLLWDSPVL